jgi:hypothetical protein
LEIPRRRAISDRETPFSSRALTLSRVDTNTCSHLVLTARGRVAVELAFVWLSFRSRRSVRDSPIGSDARFWSGRLGFESLSRSTRKPCDGGVFVLSAPGARQSPLREPVRLGASDDPWGPSYRFARCRDLRRCAGRAMTRRVLATNVPLCAAVDRGPYILLGLERYD